MTTQQTQPKITNAWALFAALVEECCGMQGDELLDKIRIERGAGYVEMFQKAYPLQYKFFIEGIIKGTIDDAMSGLQKLNPQLAQSPFSRIFIREVQNKVQRKKQ